MTTQKNEDRYIVSSLYNGIKLLELFNKNNGYKLSLSEISKALNINRSSAYRLLFTLNHLGYVKKDNSKNYRLDVKVLDITHGFLNSSSYLQEVHYEMQKLRDSTGLPVHISSLDGLEIVNLYNIQSLGSFTSNISPGLRWPAYATVIGQILLSGLSDEEIIDRYKNFNEWIAYSDATPLCLNDLLDKINYARQRSYLISWQKFNKDMIAAAAPIRSQFNNSIPYVLSVSCPSHSIDQKTFEEDVCSKLVDSAEILGKIYRPEFG